MKSRIAGGRLIDPWNGVDGQHDLYIAEGKVAGIGDRPQGFSADRVIDATGWIVCPGLVDLSARLREPGFEYKATLESELHAALAGGVTSLVCPPDTDPPLDEPGLVEMLKQRALSLNLSHVYPLGALTVGLAGEKLTEMVQLAEAGCVGFSQAEAPIVDTRVLLRALQYAQTFGYPVWLRPQDAHIGRGGVAHSGVVASRLGLSGVSEMSETLALHTIFELLRSLGKSAGAHVHLCRISSAAGIDLIRAARKEGLPISCDVAAHHIHMTDIDIGFFDANCRVDPPFRSQRDRDAIRAALADGAIDAICSDHAPVDEDAKLLPFGEAEPGVTAIELLLPLTLKWASETERTLIEALARLTSAPARLLNGPACGQLGVGAPADVCVFDPDARWKVDPRSLKSQGKNTPYIGYEVAGRVTMTLVGGEVRYQHALA